MNKKLLKLLGVVVQAINNANNNTSKLTSSILSLEGMSSLKIRHFLNNIIYNDSRYLEIGCWRGSTFVSALFNNNPEIAIAIDDWSQLKVINTSQDQPLIKNITCGYTRNCFYENINNFLKNHNIQIIERNCFDIKNYQHDISRINTYFYDGHHSKESHYKSLHYYYEFLDDQFIFVVDDWNFEEVKIGTQQAIEDLNLKKIFEHEEKSEYDGDDKNWWNGLYISILQK
jgi:hypothetical protein